MPYQYPPAFLQDFIDRMLRGESFRCLSMESGVGLQTLHRWKSQTLIDAGVRTGFTSRKLSDLREARKRIKELEDELRLVTDASEIFDALAVVDLKEGRCVAVELVTRGHSGRKSHENCWCPTFHLRCPDTAQVRSQNASAVILE